jgi:hypothetical protein
MSMSFTQSARTTRQAEPRTVRVEHHHGNVRGHFGTSLRRRAPTERLDPREVTIAVSETLAPMSAKEIADATGGSVRAAQNVREGLNAMSLTGFLNACRQFPELRALAMEMMGCEAETDPEFVAGITKLMNAYARKASSEAAE